MTALLITLHTSSGSVDVEVPSDVDIHDLLPLLVDAYDAPQPGEDYSSWELGLLVGETFSPARTLADCQIEDGTHIELRKRSAWRPLMPPGYAQI